MLSTIWSVIKTISGIPAFYELCKSALESWRSYRLEKKSDSAKEKADKDLDQRELEDILRGK